VPGFKGDSARGCWGVEDKIGRHSFKTSGEKGDQGKVTEKDERGAWRKGMESF